MCFGSFPCLSLTFFKILLQFTQSLGTSQLNKESVSYIYWKTRHILYVLHWYIFVPLSFKNKKELAQSLETSSDHEKTESSHLLWSGKFHHKFFVYLLIQFIYIWNFTVL